MADGAVVSAEKEVFKCRVTVISGGVSDAVIDIHPAEHKSEKVDLGNRPGIDRWEEIKRFMYNHARRGTAIPNPAPFHNDPKDLVTVTLHETEIPCVNLEDGAVLAAPKEERFKRPEKVSLEKENVKLRAEKAEAELSELKARMAALESALGNKTEADDTVSEGFSCPKCVRGPFPTKAALGAHNYHAHKEGK